MASAAKQWAPGDRVRLTRSADPMTAFNDKYGFTSPAGTVEGPLDGGGPGVYLVVWDSEKGPATGSGSPHDWWELEAVE